ncbi:cation:proton antiporter [Pantanalinema rosaneae CENA516]|uniref:cation:proton antiporter domain-containing protein n=1 Tax=Pantanalinema rosaneae TaxID=1620701 RepID=UPI003D6F6506
MQQLFSIQGVLPPALIINPITDPVAVFLVMITLLLVTPLVFERLRLPGIVGLILAGVVVGPYGLGILERDNTIILLGTVGLLFLMFMAGLETSLDDLKDNANKALFFGIATFTVPMVMGTIAMMTLGYNLLAATLVASCFASHTLLALPIVSKQGIMRSPAVTITLGGTLITNILALLVLAIVVKAHQGNLTLGFWLFLIPSLTLYTFITLWGVPKLGRWFFRQFGHDEGAEFTFVIATLFIVSYAAKLIEIEPIIGAFLAGISITPLIPQLSPLMNRIQFIGNTLFIPFFLLSVGMLVNPAVLLQDPRSLLVSGVMVIVAIVAKLLPAWLTGKRFKWRLPSIFLTFGLSVAQAASTLAAITVAYNIKLVDQLTVNGTIAMILVTCLISPWVTERWGQRVKRTAISEASDQISTVDDSQTKAALPYRILVPVANPSTEDNLLNLALILAKTSEGTLLPLHIITDRNQPITAEAKARQEELLTIAETVAHAAVANVEPIRRVDDTIDKGILRVAYERDANLIICGWKGYSTYRENFFGNVIDSIVQGSAVPVLITRFTHPIQTTRRVLLAVSNLEARNAALQQTIRLTRNLATELKANLEVVLLVASANQSQEQYLTELLPDVTIHRLSGRFISKVLQMLQADDLLILNTAISPITPGRPVLGAIAEAIARQNRQISMIIMHVPNTRDRRS